jgi:hypothetical protein
MVFVVVIAVFEVSFKSKTGGCSFGAECQGFKLGSVGNSAEVLWCWAVWSDPI